MLAETGSIGEYFTWETGIRHMKKMLLIVLALVVCALTVPLDSAFGRGGRGVGRIGGGSSGPRSWKSRGVRKDAAKMRERRRFEDADAILRDGMAYRRNQG